MSLLSALRTLWPRRTAPAAAPRLLPDRRLSHRFARLDRLSTTASLDVIVRRLTRGGARV